MYRKFRHYTNLRNHSKPHPTSKLKLVDILEKYDNCALLLGNGFNRSFYNQTALSWKKLVTNLWNNTHPRNIITEDYIKNKQLSLTETAEMCEKSFDDIRQSVAEVFSTETLKNEVARKFLDFLENKNIPIITTNYDKNIVNELGLSQFYTHYEHDELIDPRFQWGRYYAREEISINNIRNKFSVWNAHGTIDDSKSICFSLYDYFECGEHACRVLENVYSPFYFAPKERIPQYRNTWIDLFFNKNLCIVGLSLDENEIFLRLLLLLRFKYMKNHLGNPNRFRGWYIYTKDIEMPDSKRFFLRSVNICPIKCKSYNAIYCLS